MPYVLKDKKSGYYVGNKRFRSWDWGSQIDINKARIFKSIGGIKNWFGQLLPEDKRKEKELAWKEDYAPKMYELNHTIPFKIQPLYDLRKEFQNKYVKPYLIPVTEYYDIIELNLNDNTTTH